MASDGSSPTVVEWVRIHRRREVIDYVKESLALSRCPAEAMERHLARALGIWADGLVGRGHTGLPPGLVLDLLVDAVEPARPLAREGDVPDSIRALRRRYVRSLDNLRLIAKFRPVFDDARLTWAWMPVFRTFLEILAELVESRGKRQAVLSAADAAACMVSPRDLVGAPKMWRYEALWADLILGFEEIVESWAAEGKARDAQGMAGDWETGIDTEALRLAQAFRSEESPLGWDFEAIDRAMQLLREPLLPAAGNRLASAWMPSLRAEKVRVRSHLPEGGYVGLRPDGGLEEIASAAPSELAFPREYLFHRAAMHRLAVFERPLGRVRARKLSLGLLLLDPRLLDPTPAGRPSSPRAEVASVLVRVLAELAALTRSWNPGSIQVHVSLPESHGTFPLASVLSVSAAPGLPFFLDPNRAGIVEELFRCPMAGECRGSEPRTGDLRASLRTRWHEALDAAEESHVLFFRGEHLHPLSEELMPFLVERLEVGPSGADSLFEVRMGHAGWGIREVGCRPGKGTDSLSAAEAVRYVVVRLVRRMTGVNILHLAGGD